MEELKFYIPWFKVEQGADLENQLYQEVGPGHILHGKKVKLLAQRQDRDDFLFYVEDIQKFAVVHLTWSARKGSSHIFPSTRILNSSEEAQKKIDQDLKELKELENAPLNEIGGFIEGKKRVIIVGGSSGIGKEMAKQYALAGNIVGVTGRREDLLKELGQSFAGRIIYSVFDVTKDENIKQIENLIERLKGLDILIYSSGVGEPSKELDWELDKKTVDTNVNGFVQIANWAFNYFSKQGHGQMVVISSVAANRGNSWAPAYSASKTFQSNYFEALAIKAYRMKKKIAITCIEPGFVDTAMAKGNKRFWLVSTEKAVRQMISAIEKKKRKVYVSKRWWLVAKLMRLMPFWIYKRIG